MTRAIIYTKNQQNVIVQGGSRVVTVKDAGLWSALLGQARTASDTALNAATAALALTNFRETLAEGIADFAVNEYFSSAETGTLRLYKRIVGSPFYDDMGDAAAPLTKALLSGTGGADEIGKAGGGTVQDALDALDGAITSVVFPVVDTASGNLVAGSPNSGTSLNNTSAGTKDGDISTGFGIGVLANATSAYALSAFGYNALNAVTTGHSNTGLGYQAGAALTTGIMNTLVGVDAGFISTAMNRSVVLGHHCVNTGNYTGTGLIAIGQQTARPLTEGDDHIVIGRNAQANAPATGSNQSVIIGSNSVLASSAATSVVLGKDIMQSSGAGTRTITDSFLGGYRALFGVRSSTDNCVLGPYALFQADGSTVDSAGNTAFGGSAGYLVEASNSIFFGYRAGAKSTAGALSGVVAIGYRAGDSVGGGTALTNNDFVISNGETDGSRILWGNFSTRVLNMGGALNVPGRINADGGLKIGGTAAPANTSSTGAAGEIRYDSGFLYICTATDTWKRVAVATW